MNVILGGISLFALGYVANELTDVPTLVIVATCLAAQVALLVVNNRKGKK